MIDPSQPRLHRVQCLHAGGLHRVAYWEWGDADNPNVVVCAHGLSRQGRDFDQIARALQSRFRVICPDIVGRGQSDWLDQPMLYQLPQYMADMVTLLARLKAQRLGWVGTSMGGLIGLGLAALKHSPIDALVLNDIGPAIAAEGLQRIGSYVGQPSSFATVAEAAAYLASISSGFGPHTAAEWLELSRPMVVPHEAGWRLHYDPQIAAAMAQTTPESAKAGEAALWHMYDSITAPTLLLRGADSDILTPATAQAMTQRGPRAKRIEWPGVGHAPTLMHADQIQPVEAFLIQHMTAHAA
jgi:Predicted hydrolases or acyltransferases (alpha/beta hydrolase superfamily)